MPRKTVYARNLAHQVESAIETLGADLKAARLARRITMADAAERIGIDRRGIAAMERGAPQTPIFVIAGALWLYGLERRLQGVADPQHDAIGRALDAERRPKIARAGRGHATF